MKKIHLICNAHIDPMWQWGWEEGAAAAVSTFRCAADFCEEYGNFVFNHNEALLYQWVEEYEPDLFVRIQKLIQLRKWHIMGGWYVQPDCNMISGESFIRQIEQGRKYFLAKFGVQPTTALNIDSFGHSRGLVQILTKAGYNSYLFSRPSYESLNLPDSDFVWEGYDHSKIFAHNIFAGYGCDIGGAVPKLERYVNETKNSTGPGIMLWGVGDHGGGPSRIDIESINQFCKKLKEKDIEAFHSTPEQYFADLNQAVVKKEKEMATYNKALVTAMPGCYTSQIRIKKKHREIENLLYATEKISTAAAMAGLCEYPAEEINDAEKDLLFTQFHDILPGCSTPNVERTGLQIMEHGINILSKVRTRMLFALSKHLEKTPDMQIPIIVYNSHPYPVKTTIECEFTLSNYNWDGSFINFPVVFDGEKQLKSQLEKEDSNENFDWRKRVVFETVLTPSSINRFNCKLERHDTLDETKTSWRTKEPIEDKETYDAKTNGYVFCLDRQKIVVSKKTGLIDSFEFDGKPIIGTEGIKIKVCKDISDSWGMKNYINNNYIDEFKIASAEQATVIAATDYPIEPIRIIENGEVRTVIEAILIYHKSYAIFHYIFSKVENTVEIKLKLFIDEKDKLFKMSIPTVFKGNVQYIGQDAFGTAVLNTDGSEQTHQYWSAAIDDNYAVAIVNDGIYGSDFADGNIHLSLLRTAPYCCDQFFDRARLPIDRYTARMDQGEHEYGFIIKVGQKKELLESIDRVAQIFNEKPFSFSFFPAGRDTKKTDIAIEIKENHVVVLSCLKKSIINNGYIARIFNPTKEKQVFLLSVPVYNLERRVEMKEFDILTFNISEKEINITDII